MTPPGIEISADRARLDVDLIHRFLNGTYWAAGRSRATVERSLEHSLCFGAYAAGRQVGFGRVITDRAVFAYLSDIFVVPEWRGRGIGKAIVRAMLDHPDLRDLKIILLSTRDAHGTVPCFRVYGAPAPAGDDGPLSNARARRGIERVRTSETCALKIAVSNRGGSFGRSAGVGGPMAKVTVNAFSISIDGYGAGPTQSLEHPLGVGGLALHEWAFATRTFQRMFGREGGASGIDDEFAARSFENVGAWILGRNMFGPVRGPWPDDSWKGWWGDTPPYHVPVFVLTHHPRHSIVMQGGTTFHFVTEGIHAALERAVESAGGRNVRIGGGVATIQQYLRAGLIDEFHLAVSPVLLGRGERLFAGIDLVELGYRCTEHVATPNATHFVLSRRDGA